MQVNGRQKVESREKEWPAVGQYSEEWDRRYRLKMRGYFQRVVTAGEWEQVIVKALEQAKGGDKDARNWLAGWVVGTVPQTSHMDIAMSSSEGMDRLTDEQRETIRQALISKAKEVEEAIKDPRILKMERDRRYRKKKQGAMGGG